MILAFIKSVGIILGVAFLGALILSLCAAGADETGRSILYDNPEYFKHNEPEWLRREDEDDEK